MRGFSSDSKEKHQTLITVIRSDLLLLVCFVVEKKKKESKKLTLSWFLPAPDSLGAPFPSTSHRCHHKPKRCLPIQCGNLPISPLLFHPNAKGSLIVMDLAQKTVKRLASFCNAITFSNRPIALYEQVRLKVFPAELNGPKALCIRGQIRVMKTQNVTFSDKVSTDSSSASMARYWITF